MILDDKDKQNLIDALKEWNECVGCKELSEEDVGLNHDRYVDLMRRLGVIEHLTMSVERGLIEKAKKWDEHVRDLKEHGGG